MKTVLVNNSIEASSVCIDLINKELNKASKRLNIALTGGRFGKYFADELTKSSIILEKIRFFQTDERLVRFSDQDSIQKMLLDNLAKFSNLEHCFFDLNMSATASALNMSKNIDKLKLDKLDIAMMSLGEDGHLAGNFPKSKKISNMITYINDSPKPPPKRISFSVEWLAKSHLVIIVALGNDKDEAVRDLVSENNPFSTYIEGSRNLFFITDQRSSINIY